MCCKIDKLVHLTINGEEIVSTVDHPFFVKGKGFVYASDLYIGAELIDKDGNTVTVSHIYREKLEGGSTNVYNFKVEDFHTYYVSEQCVLVHNAEYDTKIVSKNMKERIPNDELEPPKNRGDAPISKKDGKPIEIHHNEQNPNGPFYEKTQTEHRLGENYKKNHPNGNKKSKINRSQWKTQKRNYWCDEWDAGRWN